MKTQRLILILLVLISLSSCSSMMQTMMNKKMFKHYNSQYDFNTTVDTLKNAFNSSSIWVILEEKDNAETYKDNGDIGNYIELHLCHPPSAFKILSDDKTQFMAAMIPLQMCIYENSQKEVKISVMNVKMMSKMFKDRDIKQNVKDAASEMFSILNRIEK